MKYSLYVWAMSFFLAGLFGSVNAVGQNNNISNLPNKGDFERKIAGRPVYIEQAWSNGLTVKKQGAEIEYKSVHGQVFYGPAGLRNLVVSANREGHFVKTKEVRYEGDQCLNCIKQERIEFSARSVKDKVFQVLVDGLHIEKTYKKRLGGKRSYLSEEKRYKENQLVSKKLWEIIGGRELPLLEEYENRRISYQYDSAGNVISKIEQDKLSLDKEKRVTLFEYAEGRLVSKDGAREDVKDYDLYKYDDLGNLESSINALGHRIRYEYDELNRVIVKTDKNNVRTEYQYDGLNNLISVIEAVGTKYQAETQYQYDLNGKKIRTIFPSGRVVEHSYQAAESIADIKGRDVNNSDTEEAASYDERGRLVKVVNSDGGVTRYGYDAYGNLAATIDPRGVKTSYTYDGFGQKIEEVSPSTGITLFEYDQAGNVILESRSNGVKIIRHYDELNRLVKAVYRKKGQEKRRIKYKYDSCANGVGRLCKVVGLGSKEEYQYNIVGDLVVKAVKIKGDPKTYTTRYGYDKYRRLINLRYPSGAIIHYAYNSESKVVSVRLEHAGQSWDVVSQIDYSNSESSKVSAIAMGNGLVANYLYENGQLVEYELTDLLKRKYSYDESGNIIEIESSDPSLLKNRSYRYDSMGRLLEDSVESKVVNYSYDQVGNRLQKSVLSESKHKLTNYAYGDSSNRLVSINRKNVVYDQGGNLLEDKNGKRKFEYDVTNRLVNYYKNGALRSSYSYNAKGQRFRKRIHNRSLAKEEYRSLTFTYGLNGNLLSEDSRQGVNTKGITRDYIWLGNKPLAQLQTKYNKKGRVKKLSLSFIHADHLNTPRIATDQSRNVVWQWDSGAFGEGKVNRDFDGDGNKIKLRVRFPGQYYDGESKLHYNYFRDYDPSIGRYVQSDPKGLRARINTYAYASGNPLSRVDNYGLVDINLIPLTDEIQRRGANNTNRSDAITVAAHGTATALFGMRPGDANITASALANRIRGHQKYQPGMPVYIYACNVGNSSQAAKNGRVPFAEALARELPGSTIYAPSTFGWFNENRWVGIYDRNANGQPIYTKKGEWVQFSCDC